MKKIKRLKVSKTLMLIVSGMVVIMLIGGFLWLHHYLHRSDITPNNSTPRTGMSVVFNPPLKHTAKLEIDDSNEKMLKTVSLVRANDSSSAQSVSNPLGIRYNIALNEGVYRIKVTSSKYDFPPFISTVTVSDHTLTTENVSFTGSP